ncbi:PEGA domain-containing protein [Candidatus Woesebacteria bacterium]|nr:PEGA domain-containing protein [Candidatus Woesebacteria bacterium]
MKPIFKAVPVLTFRLILLILFICVALVVIAFARGYRWDFKEHNLTSTGIIYVNSFPTAAKVYLNGDLKGVTDSNLTLPYGTYTVEVQKEGYSSWKKTVSLQGEIVLSLNARLFSKNPSLSPLTNLGVSKIVPIGNSDRYVLVTNIDNEEKNGLYLFESGKKPLGFFSPLKLLLVSDTLPNSLDPSSVELHYSPNYRQAVVTFSPKIDENQILADIIKRTDLKTTSYLISLEDENTQLFDVTTSIDNILQAWDEELNNATLKLIEALPQKIRTAAKESMLIVSVSPDEKKIMYVAKHDTTLPFVINPPLIGSNQTKEVRLIEVGDVYIYDTKEDKNYKVNINTETIKELVGQRDFIIAQDSQEVATTEPTVEQYIVWDDEIARLVHDQAQWYPTSDYIGIKRSKQIDLVSYDGTNNVTVYAGPFDKSFFGFDANWNLIILTNLNPDNNEFGDLYSVGII